MALKLESLLHQLLHQEEETTPHEITDQIRNFCRRIINRDTPPCFVKVQPFEDSVPGECFDNVQKYVSQHSGSVQYGWIIWEVPGKLLDAEFHAVWRAPDGTLLDVSPHEETKILFLPDNTRVWENKPVPNIRLPLDNSLKIRKIIRLGEVRDNIRAKHCKNGEFDAKAADQEYRSYLKSLQETGRNDPCPCGSGKKFKKCCLWIIE